MNDESEERVCNCETTCARCVSTSAAPTTSLHSKLSEFDRHSETAFRWLLCFCEEHQEEILTVARARHITGHFVYADGKMYEYGDGRLVKEVVEEVADALVYAAVRLGRREAR